MNDARDLVALALTSARREPFEREWTPARIEAAMRRVINELGTLVAITVQQESERQDASSGGGG